MIFIDACFKKPTPRTPIWMMRQAGRCLPEYREVRKRVGNFIDMTKNPDVVCEVTLQPVERFDVDAAILFSDILNLPMEMGLNLRFEAGVGPIFDNPISTSEDIDKLTPASDKLEYVYEGVSKIREKLDPSKALIGFAGSPWTIATYMVEGRGSKQYPKIKRMVYADPDTLHKLLAFNTQETIGYLKNQIKAGANAVMVFDSWGGALEKEKFFEFSWNYMKKIASSIKKEYPNIPVILFSKGVGLYLEDMVDGEFDVIGIDWNTPIEYAANIVNNQKTIQGNMDPTRLYSQEATKEAVLHIADVMKDKHHIFNLGHGILPDTPWENVKYFVDLVKETTKR
ncbi:MAG: uroporphyrinogen decarboxylase [Epsilonproteobacteria bacterium]|nr:uroporphyrinogen decarboxylase [Campylobacterota bacterium]